MGAGGCGRDSKSACWDTSAASAPCRIWKFWRRCAEKLEQVATTQPVFQLWWVTGAILEAVRANGLEGSATLKRLLGQADRQIKALYELGEARYCEDPPIDLLNNLLYYVARASTSGGRISAVRASFKLAELLPVDDSIEQERESLSAPSVKLMRTVAAAIKEDLSKVKDVLDIFVRRGGGQTDELAPQLELLKKISDTLGVLGLGELRQRVQDEIAALSRNRRATAKCRPRRRWSGSPACCCRWKTASTISWCG